MLPLEKKKKIAYFEFVKCLFTYFNLQLILFNRKTVSVAQSQSSHAQGCIFLQSGLYSGLNI